jgi:hypothetical protein
VKHANGVLADAAGAARHKGLAVMKLKRLSHYDLQKTVVYNRRVREA